MRIEFAQFLARLSPLEYEAFEAAVISQTDSSEDPLLQRHRRALERSRIKILKFSREE
ncbi:Competence-specific sigma factor ComX, ECF-type [Lacticaseibacillus paracasei subsp. paracasei Lpp225]|jgi:RNA polymerase sporulation-specific sigma factor|nr:ComX [Lacticaseibacillus paracasei]EPC23290.1 Competence-specific sigma factor ComX, ECF-type [Lacticaseibacillus paracasei subsp. paracasei Lpp226]EPC29105.1 Competence-specific sigma factor ComX, ECF-type [Lacticaseibacillus paracasei subsp. paracasei Lpp17]EPC29201.1 Competence-specific sigma factor ComX, ECF-type [Lacticaseibacillus paracasei subsp. paracasei Lpp46]EPC30785.1 Competence-specific sigma factor ComX, ECF-type [Lacticaseibacillus paracasei subsp. paracasei Lpp223]EPC33705.1